MTFTLALAPFYLTVYRRYVVQGFLQVWGYWRGGVDEGGGGERSDMLKQPPRQIVYFFLGGVVNFRGGDSILEGETTQGGFCRKLWHMETALWETALWSAFIALGVVTEIPNWDFCSQGKGPHYGRNLTASTRAVFGTSVHHNCDCKWILAVYIGIVIVGNISAMTKNTMIY